MPLLFSLVFAVNQGSRMKSKKSKALHEICGETILDRLTRHARKITPDNCIVSLGSSDREFTVDFKQDESKLIFIDENNYACRPKMLQAVLNQTLTATEKSGGNIFVLTPEYPLIRERTLLQVNDCHVADGNACTVITGPDPAAPGVTILCAAIKPLLRACDEASDLAEIPGIIARGGGKVETFSVSDPTELFLVTDLASLAAADKLRRKRINERHMRNGVQIIDPDSTYIHPGVRIGMDTVIHPGTHLEKHTEIGGDCVIGPNARLVGMKLGDRVEVRYSTAYESTVGDGTKIGPNAYIRPGSEIGSDVKIGDFVEIKKSRVGNGTKISHLAYVGDAEVGEGVNIGCGVVFANYDGKNKHKTIVGDGAFIGSNSNLIAPVTIGPRAFIAAGSTITDDVSENSFAIARERQVTKDGYMLTKRDAPGGKK